MLQVEIRVKGRIDEQWSEWFDGMTISHSESGETVFTGIVQDQSALYGFIAKLRDLGMQLSSVYSEEKKDDQSNVGLHS